MRTGFDNLAFSSFRSAASIDTMKKKENKNNENSIEPQQWRRLEHGGKAVYVQPETPDWLVTSPRGDQLFQALLSKDSSAADLDGKRLQRLLFPTGASPYKGRYHSLKLGKLKECWVHLTDKCNLSCQHCLFSSSPHKKRSLSADELCRVTREAMDLGCRLFYFTGGEPFIYPDFLSYLKSLLADNPTVHAVVLTNGMKLSEQMSQLCVLDRLHLQVSLDGMEAAHNSLRGKGSFQKLIKNLQVLKENGLSATLSVAVSRENVEDLSQIVELADDLGVSNIHLLYHFIRGKGTREQFVDPQTILSHLLPAWHRADQLGIEIDNIESLRSQVFSTPGTRHDLSNSAWESMTLGPDGRFYPSPALVSLPDCCCGELSQGLAEVWESSEVLNDIRKASLLDSADYRKNPLKFIIGGGDIDHSFMNSGEWVGHDPYTDIYNKIVLQLIVDQEASYNGLESAPIKLRMGDVRHDCLDEDSSQSEVALTHCNCVISLTSDSGHGSVKEFYGQAALRANDDIVNPLAPEQKEADFIPDDAKEKSYGCGSPVTDAELQPGETLVDLGSGSGVECFMAAATVGREGKVYGIDMTAEMLNLAQESKREVVERLGYDNVSFHKGFLEEIPLNDGLADAVISNCVINLSPDKRKTYQEIFRLLKPGGRLIVSDIVTDSTIPPAIKNNIKYRGECLGGAMQQEELVAMMEAAGLVGIRFIKRFPYRLVEGLQFYSLTYLAMRPLEKVGQSEMKEVIYRGPYQGVYTEQGKLLLKGRRAWVDSSDSSLFDESVFILDDQSSVVNVAMENSCCNPQAEIPAMDSSCCSPKIKESSCCSDEAGAVQERHSSGCMLCGAELSYATEAVEMACCYCGSRMKSNNHCTKGHFVCDNCHRQNGLQLIKTICWNSQEKDMLSLLATIRSHPEIPMHGPEHHIMVPGVLLACFRNSGGDISRETILSGIDRGADVPGGVCGYWGTCGAAIGVGIGVSMILSATPLTPSPRQLAQEITAKVLASIAQYKGGRCCQRESWLALKEIARLSENHLPVKLSAEGELSCRQYLENKECIRKQCPLWEGRACDIKKPLQVVPLGFN